MGVSDHDRPFDTSASAVTFRVPLAVAVYPTAAHTWVEKHDTVVRTAGAVRLALARADHLVPPTSPRGPG